MTERRRWPTITERLEHIEKGVLDDTTDAVPSYGVSGQELLGMSREEILALTPEKLAIIGSTRENLLAVLDQKPDQELQRRVNAVDMLDDCAVELPPGGP